MLQVRAGGRKSKSELKSESKSKPSAAADLPCTGLCLNSCPLTRTALAKHVCCSMTQTSLCCAVHAMLPSRGYCLDGMQDLCLPAYPPTWLTRHAAGVLKELQLPAHRELMCRGCNTRF